MTPQEQSMLQDLARRVQQTQLTDKDPEAEQYLQQTLGQEPNALYILAQTVLVQTYALEQARRQLDQQRQAQAQPPAQHTSFLGSLLGHHDPAPRPQPQPQYSGSQYSGSQYSAPAPPPPSYAAPQYGPGPSGGGGSSFLRNAAQTAAGVAAGALAFEGVESLMHGFGHAAGFGGGGFGGPGLGGFGGGAPVEETVVNNYYDDPGRGGDDRGDDRNFDRASDPGNYDSGNDAANLQDASYDLGGQDDASNDLSNDPGLDAMDSGDDSSIGDGDGGGDDSFV